MPAWSARLLGRSGNEHPIGAHQLRIRHLGLKLDSLHSSLFLRLGNKRQQVLTAQPARYVLKIRNERNRRTETEVISFPTSLVGNLRQIILPPVQSPETMAVVTLPRRVDAKNDDASALS